MGTIGRSTQLHDPVKYGQQKRRVIKKKKNFRQWVATGCSSLCLSSPSSLCNDLIFLARAFPWKQLSGNLMGRADTRTRRAESETPREVIRPKVARGSRAALRITPADQRAFCDIIVFNKVLIYTYPSFICILCCLLWNASQSPHICFFFVSVCL